MWNVKLEKDLASQNLLFWNYQSKNSYNFHEGKYALINYRHELAWFEKFVKIFPTFCIERLLQLWTLIDDLTLSMKLGRAKLPFKILITFCNSQTYSETSRKSKIELYCNKELTSSAINCFLKKLHLRDLTGFLTHFRNFSL